MEVQIKTSTLLFLSELKDNNDREWFQENKKRYTDSVESFKHFINALIVGIQEIDNSLGSLTPEECIFRIYRDVRFSANKEPYKTNFGAYMAPGGRKSQLAGYYFHVEPGSSFLSGGIYMAPPEIMRRVREDIADYSEEFLKIVDANNFKKCFSFRDAEKLKKIPRGFEPGSTVDEYLKMKYVAPAHPLADDEITSPRMLENSLNTFKELYPLIHFLNRAIR
ncbi:MAG: DUF2461 domain-containing protein [Bacteroidales bacterium]